MLKKLGGCLVIVVVLLSVGTWFAMRTVKESLGPDGIARVTIAATPHRVYTSLSDGDSLATWMTPGSTVTTSRRGPLSVGDAIHVQLKNAFGPAQRPLTWRVSELVPDLLVGLQLMNESDTRPLASRRDSLVAVGDSTMIMSLVSSFVPDTAKGTSGMAADMMMSMFRVQSKLELQNLKVRIEGRPAPAKPAPRK
jgi:uncharacterized protein YndB with AHSA1/START domain